MLLCYYVISMYDNDLADKIRNYGRLSYNNGYNNGFISGLVIGCIIGISSILIFNTK